MSSAVPARPKREPGRRAGGLARIFMRSMKELKENKSTRVPKKGFELINKTISGSVEATNKTSSVSKALPHTGHKDLIVHDSKTESKADENLTPSSTNVLTSNAANNDKRKQQTDSGISDRDNLPSSTHVDIYSKGEHNTKTTAGTGKPKHNVLVENANNNAFSKTSKQETTPVAKSEKSLLPKELPVSQVMDKKVDSVEDKYKRETISSSINRSRLDGNSDPRKRGPRRYSQRRYSNSSRERIVENLGPEDWNSDLLEVESREGSFHHSNTTEQSSVFPIMHNEDESKINVGKIDKYVTNREKNINSGKNGNEIDKQESKKSSNDEGDEGTENDMDMGCLNNLDQQTIKKENGINSDQQRIKEENGMNSDRKQTVDIPPDNIKTFTESLDNGVSIEKTRDNEMICGQCLEIGHTIQNTSDVSTKDLDSKHLNDNASASVYDNSGMNSEQSFVTISRTELVPEITGDLKQCSEKEEDIYQEGHVNNKKNMEGWNNKIHEKQTLEKLQTADSLPISSEKSTVLQLENKVLRKEEFSHVLKKPQFAVENEDKSEPLKHNGYEPEIQDLSKDEFDPDNKETVAFCDLRNIENSDGKGQEVVGTETPPLRVPVCDIPAYYNRQRNSGTFSDSSNLSHSSSKKILNIPDPVPTHGAWLDYSSASSDSSYTERTSKPRLKKTKRKSKYTKSIARGHTLTVSPMQMSPAGSPSSHKDIRGRHSGIDTQSTYNSMIQSKIEAMSKEMKAKVLTPPDSSVKTLVAKPIMYRDSLRAMRQVRVKAQKKNNSASQGSSEQKKQEISKSKPVIVQVSTDPEHGESSEYIGCKYTDHSRKSNSESTEEENSISRKHITPEPNFLPTVSSEQRKEDAFVHVIKTQVSSDQQHPYSSEHSHHSSEEETGQTKSGLIGEVHMSEYHNHTQSRIDGGLRSGIQNDTDLTKSSKDKLKVIGNVLQNHKSVIRQHGSPTRKGQGNSNFKDQHRVEFRHQEISESKEHLSQELKQGDKLQSKDHFNKDSRHLETSECRDQHNVNPKNVSAIKFKDQCTEDSRDQGVSECKAHCKIEHQNTSESLEQQNREIKQSITSESEAESNTLQSSCPDHSESEAESKILQSRCPNHSESEDHHSVELENQYCSSSQQPSEKNDNLKFVGSVNVKPVKQEQLSEYQNVSENKKKENWSSSSKPKGPNSSGVSSSSGHTKTLNSIRDYNRSGCIRQGNLSRGSNSSETSRTKNSFRVHNRSEHKRQDKSYGGHNSCPKKQDNSSSTQNRSDHTRLGISDQLHNSSKSGGQDNSFQSHNRTEFIKQSSSQGLNKSEPTTKADSSQSHNGSAHNIKKNYLSQIHNSTEPVSHDNLSQGHNRTEPAPHDSLSEGHNRTELARNGNLSQGQNRTEPVTHDNLSQGHNRTEPAPHDSSSQGHNRSETVTHDNSSQGFFSSESVRQGNTSQGHRSSESVRQTNFFQGHRSSESKRQGNSLHGHNRMETLTTKGGKKEHSRKDNVQSHSTSENIKYKVTESRVKHSPHLGKQNCFHSTTNQHNRSGSIFSNEGLNGADSQGLVDTNYSHTESGTGACNSLKRQSRAESQNNLVSEHDLGKQLGSNTGQSILEFKEEKVQKKNEEKLKLGVKANIAEQLETSNENWDMDLLAVAPPPDCNVNISDRGKWEIETIPHCVGQGIETKIQNEHDAYPTQVNDTDTGQVDRICTTCGQSYHKSSDTQKCVDARTSCFPVGEHLNLNSESSKTVCDSSSEQHCKSSFQQGNTKKSNFWKDVNRIKGDAKSSKNLSSDRKDNCYLISDPNSFKDVDSSSQDLNKMLVVQPKHSSCYSARREWKQTSHQKKNSELKYPWFDSVRQQNPLLDESEENWDSNLLDIEGILKTQNQTKAMEQIVPGGQESKATTSIVSNDNLSVKLSESGQQIRHQLEEWESTLLDLNFIDSVEKYGNNGNEKETLPERLVNSEWCDVQIGKENSNDDGVLLDSVTTTCVSNDLEENRSIHNVQEDEGSIIPQSDCSLSETQGMTEDNCTSDDVMESHVFLSQEECYTRASTNPEMIYHTHPNSSESFRPTIFSHDAKYARNFEEKDFSATGNDPRHQPNPSRKERPPGYGSEECVCPPAYIQFWTWRCCSCRWGWEPRICDVRSALDFSDYFTPPSTEDKDTADLGLRMRYRPRGILAMRPNKAIPPPPSRELWNQMQQGAAPVNPLPPRGTSAPSPANRPQTRTAYPRMQLPGSYPFGSGYDSKSHPGLCGMRHCSPYRLQSADYRLQSPLHQTAAAEQNVVKEKTKYSYDPSKQVANEHSNNTGKSEKQRNISSIGIEAVSSDEMQDLQLNSPKLVDYGFSETDDSEEDKKDEHSKARVVLFAKDDQSQDSDCSSEKRKLEENDISDEEDCSVTSKRRHILPQSNIYHFIRHSFNNNSSTNDNDEKATAYVPPHRRQRIGPSDSSHKDSQKIQENKKQTTFKKRDNKVLSPTSEQSSSRPGSYPWTPFWATPPHTLSMPVSPLFGYHQPPCVYPPGCYYPPTDWYHGNSESYGGAYPQPTHTHSTNYSAMKSSTTSPLPTKVNASDACNLQTDLKCSERLVLPPRIQFLERTRLLGQNTDSESNSSFTLVDWKVNFKEKCKSYCGTFVDSHCHLDFLFNRQGFKGTWSKYKILHEATMPHSFEGCVAVFCHPGSFRQEGLWKEIALEEDVWLAFGCHPKNATEFSPRAEEGLIRCLQHKKVVALGEIGLDYSGIFKQHKSSQKIVFIKQIQLALEMNKPLVIHCREAEEDALQILEETVPRNYRIHCHCFTGDYESAKKWMNLFPNLYIGLTPLVTYRTATPSHEVARFIPLDRLLLETDAPYFIPRKFPKEDVQFSHPGMAITVAEQVAFLKRCSVTEVLHACRQNTRTMYGV
ncbi:uncharacterized protein LOC117331467 [Pecten maximus]|uniref:uncharacterized protein LOC117331467 n=1 Tax=Pecten maximus TaxID=6579 RepID=UPI001458A7EC|nr:uncharacterized protein LOC117331467 [Pecten maximus]